MKQLILIGGGEVFDNEENYKAFLEECSRDLLDEPKKRKNNLIEAVSSEYETINVKLPNSLNAKYWVWKIWFEKYYQYLKSEDIVLIGRSLGATFLLKYLSENSFGQNTTGNKFYNIQLHLVAPLLDIKGIEDTEWPGKLMGIADFDIDISRLSSISSEADKIYIYHSKDDSVVPFEHGQRISDAIPDAKFETFETRGHFFQPAFPELLENIGIYQRNV